MKPVSPPARTEVPRAATLLVWFISAVALGLRFVHLQADFPSGINWSGDLYTDEGWYANSAINHHLTGRWILEGDFNPIVSLPVFQLILAAAFRAFGMSLATARATVAVSSVLVIMLTYLLVRRLTGARPALMALVLLSTNFTLFAFSRLAILELPMTGFVLLSFLVATSAGGPRPVNLGLAALSLSLGTLTKSTALLALPALLYLVGSAAPTVRQGVRASLAVVGAIAGALGAYYLAAYLWLPEEIVRFLSVEFPPRVEMTLPSIGRALARAAWHGVVLDPLVYPLTLASLPIVFLTVKHIARHRLVVACTLWLATDLLALAVRGYLPPRYYLPVIAPVVMLFAVVLALVWDRLRPWRWSYAPAILAAGIAAFHFASIVAYLNEPEYTFRRMADDVRRLALSGASHPLVVGNMANSITLATGIPSINSKEGTRPLEWRLARYRPGYYIALGEEGDTARRIGQLYGLEPLATYDVFGNYYAGKRVHFYRLVSRR